jgi:hypothetical protein
MSTYPRLPRRLWHLRPWQRSPLMRAEYRVQWVVRALMIVLMTLAVPVSAGVATATYNDMLYRSDHAPAVHTVAATLDSDAIGPAIGPGGGTAHAHWTVDGHRHGATIAVSGLAHKDDLVPVVVTADGNPAPTPISRSHALPNAIAMALISLTSSVIIVVLLRNACDTVFERRNSRHWAEEWATLADTPKWNRLS